MFTPTDISGCWFWLKMDDAIADTSNNVVSLNNSGYQSCTFYPLTDLPDKNILSRFNLNNHSTIMGVDEGAGLTTGLIQDLPNTPKVTAIYLYKQNEPGIGANVHYLFRGPENESNFGSIHVFQSILQLSNIWSFYTDFNSYTSFDGYLDDWIIRSDIVDDNIVTFKRNGIAVSSGTLVTPLPDISSPPYNGEGECILGGYTPVPSGYDRPNGELAEVIIYDRRIADSEVTQVENYLKYKYFVAGTRATPLFMNGSTTGTSGQYNPFTTLYVESVPASSVIPLYTAQAYIIDSGCPLYTIGVPHVESGVPLYIASSPANSSVFPLYTIGDTITNDGISLYTASAPSENNNILLYTLTGTPSASGMDLFVHGIFVGSGVMPLYIGGLHNRDVANTTPLYIAVNTNSSSPGVSGIYSGASLFTQSAAVSPGLPLYVKADNQADQDNSLPLFLKSEANSVFNSTDLYLQNNNEGWANSAKMFVKGLGQLDGGLIDHSNMNLYIERLPADGISLFINSSITPSSIPLYIGAANTISSGVSLAMSGGPQISIENNFPIFTYAGDSQYNTTTLYTAGIPTATQSINIYTNGF